jgi:hypothetical protein
MSQQLPLFTLDEPKPQVPNPLTLLREGAALVCSELIIS